MGSKSKQPAARLGDIDTGHPGAPPTPIITASTNVFTNGIPAGRKGDQLAPHHPGIRLITEGSSSVHINGRPAARVTDAINCGGKMAIGSGNVFIGDDPQLEKPTPPDTYVAEFELYKTDNRSYEGYYYEIRTLGGKILGEGKTDPMGYTQVVETEMSQRVRAFQSLLPESERITESWAGKIESAASQVTLD